MQAEIRVKATAFIEDLMQNEQVSPDGAKYIFH